MGCGIPTVEDIKKGIANAKGFIDEETKTSKKKIKVTGEKKTKPKKSGESKKKTTEEKKKKKSNQDDQ